MRIRVDTFQVRFLHEVRFVEMSEEEWREIHEAAEQEFDPAGWDAATDSEWLEKERKKRTTADIERAATIAMPRTHNAAGAVIVHAHSHVTPMAPDWQHEHETAVICDWNLSVDPKVSVRT